MQQQHKSEANSRQATNRRYFSNEVRVVQSNVSGGTRKQSATRSNYQTAGGGGVTRKSSSQLQSKLQKSIGK